MGYASHAARSGHDGAVYSDAPDSVIAEAEAGRSQNILEMG
jgi:hypothetical protein